MPFLEIRPYFSKLTQRIYHRIADYFIVNIKIFGAMHKIFRLANTGVTYFFQGAPTVEYFYWTIFLRYHIRFLKSHIRCSSQTLPLLFSFSFSTKFRKQSYKCHSPNEHLTHRLATTFSDHLILHQISKCHDTPRQPITKRSSLPPPSLHKARTHTNRSRAALGTAAPRAARRPPRRARAENLTGLANKTRRYRTA